mmetsp:Transcript_29237/g.66240  ORF Transcript_29237/g.66240 Transcript_29237/m.66240 type:complete len:90 (+) Transcript_29237:24-293(+)
MHTKLLLAAAMLETSMCTLQPTLPSFKPCDLSPIRLAATTRMNNNKTELFQDLLGVAKREEEMNRAAVAPRSHEWKPTRLHLLAESNKN